MYYNDSVWNVRVRNGRGNMYMSTCIDLTYKSLGRLITLLSLNVKIKGTLVSMEFTYV